MNAVNLWDECLAKFGTKTIYTLLSAEETDQVVQSLEVAFPFALFSIDWSLCEHQIECASSNEIYAALVAQNQDLAQQVYVIWDDASLPAIACTIHDVLENIDDILPISFYTWIFSADEAYVIQFHESQCRMGFQNS